MTIIEPGVKLDATPWVGMRMRCETCWAIIELELIDHPKVTYKRKPTDRDRDYQVYVDCVYCGDEMKRNLPDDINKKFKQLLP